MSFFQSMDAGVTSSTSQAMKLPICSRYSLLALSRETQNDLLIDGGTTTVRDGSPEETSPIENTSMSVIFRVAWCTVPS